MKLPNVMNIQGTDYKIEIKDDLRNPMGEPLDGNCDRIKQKLISIDPSISGRYRDMIFLHETFHAALYESGISRAISEDLEECIVDCLSTFTMKNFNVSVRRKR